MKIGIMADSLRLPFEQSIVRAKELGADGVQVYAVAGEMAPENMSGEDIRVKRDIIVSNGLVVSALCGDLGGHGFCLAEENPAKIEKSKRILDLAKKFGCDVVTTHIGVIPEDVSCKTYSVLHDACKELADYADAIGSHFAIETGPEPADRLAAFLDTLGSTGVGVNLDPANLVMVTCDDPVKAVYTLKKYIVHTHAKDGICLKQTDPQIIYDYFAGDGIEDIHLKDYFTETPLGKGNVDFPEYISALKDIGYNGFLTVERETGATPDADIKLAVDTLKKYI